MTLTEAFTLYTFEEVKLKGGAEKTLRNYNTVLNSILSALADIPIEMIDHQAVIRWKMHMHSKGKQPSTIKSELGKLRQILKYLKDHNYKVMDYRDIDLPRVVRKESTWLDVDEIKLMIEACTNIRDKAIVMALFSSGGRISEVLSLNRNSIVDGKAEVLSKGSKWVTLYFDNNTIRTINEYLDSRNDKIPALFISGQYRRITVSRVEQIFHVLEAEAGIEKNVTPHVMRHSFATDLLTNGADLKTVQEHLNHSSIMTTMVYAHMSKGRKDETYKKHHTIL